MKRVKFLFVFIFLLIGTLTVLALSSKNYRKSPKARKCLRYTGTADPIYSWMISDYDNWTELFVDPISYCSPGGYLCAVCYNNLTTTPAQAIDILSIFYDTYGYLPSHGQTIVGYGSRQVTIYQKDTE